MPEPEIDKGKKVVNSPSSFENSFEYVSSHLYIRDNFSHVIIKIHLQGSNQPKAATERSKEGSSEKRKTTSHGKYGFWCCYWFGNILFFLDIKHIFRNNVLDIMDIILFLVNNHVLFFLIIKCLTIYVNGIYKENVGAYLGLLYFTLCCLLKSIKRE